MLVLTALHPIRCKSPWDLHRLPGLFQREGKGERCMWDQQVLLKVSMFIKCAKERGTMNEWQLTVLEHRRRSKEQERLNCHS